MPYKTSRRLLSTTKVLLGCALLLSVGCTPVPSVSRPQIRPEGPRLVLILIVDQFRFDYFERFDRHYEGGIRWLLDHGAVFENANYDHAVTATAPGHSALATGLHPAHSGIVGNSWYDREARRPTYSFDDAEHGRSPANLLGTALPDWIRELDPETRVYSLSHKDRSAIALGGHRADGAFWYTTDTGEFTSSSYYPDPQPEWLQTFNDRKIPDVHFALPWEPLELTDQERTEAGVVDTDEGLFSKSLPRSFGGPALAPSSSFYAAYRGSPFADEYLLELARTIIHEKELGQGDRLDYLSVGLSVLDATGHSYGPHSQEVADTLLRLDRSLGRFLEFIDEEIGLDRVVIGFSSDHGVLPVPELLASHGQVARRFTPEDNLCVQSAGLRVEEELGLENWVLSGFYLDHEAIELSAHTFEEVEAAVAEEVQACAGVARVWKRSELLAAPMDDLGRFGRLYRHSFHPDRSADLMLQLEEGVIATNTRATHGSPYVYDTHVPLIIRAPGVPAGRLQGPARPVDLAPTLAALLGISTPANLDGHDLGPDLHDPSSMGAGSAYLVSPTPP